MPGFTIAQGRSAKTAFHKLPLLRLDRPHKPDIPSISGNTLPCRECDRGQDARAVSAKARFTLPFYQGAAGGAADAAS